MSVKNRDTEEGAAFWDFVEETARQVRENSPPWARDVVAADSGDDEAEALMLSPCSYASVVCEPPRE